MTLICVDDKGTLDTSPNKYDEDHTIDNQQQNWFQKDQLAERSDILLWYLITKDI